LTLSQGSGVEEDSGDASTNGASDGPGDDATTSGDGDGTTASGDGDGTTTSGDGDGTTSSGDGDGTTSSGDGDGDGTTSSGDGDGTTSSGDGDGTTSGDGDGTTSGDGDGTTSSGDGDGTATSGDGDGTTTFGGGSGTCATDNPRIPVSCGSSPTGSFIGNYGDVEELCGQSFQFQDQLFEFSPTADATVDLQYTMTPDQGNGMIFVMQGVCDSAACIGSSIDDNADWHDYTFSATAGTTYYILLEAPSAQPNFQLTVTCS
jgi:hypothetical protein